MRSMLRCYADAMDRISVFIGHACAMLYMACVALSAFEVTMRYVFDRPTIWTFETIMALCATAWVMTSGYVTERRRHIAITMIEMTVSPRTWRLLTLVQMIVSVFAIGALAWAIYGPAVMAVTTVERSGSAFNPALPAYLKALLFVGCILYLLQLVANIIRWFDGPAAEPDAGKGAA